MMICSGAGCLLPLQRSTMQAQYTSTRRLSSFSRTTQCCMQTGRLHTSKSRSMALLSVMPQRPSKQTQPTQRYSLVINIRDSVCIKRSTTACSYRMVLGSNTPQGLPLPGAVAYDPLPHSVAVQTAAAVNQQDVCLMTRGGAGSIQGRSDCRAAGTSHSHTPSLSHTRSRMCCRQGAWQCICLKRMALLSLAAACVCMHLSDCLSGLLPAW